MYFNQFVCLLTGVAVLLSNPVTGQIVQNGGFGLCSNIENCLEVVSKPCPTTPNSNREICIRFIPSGYCAQLLTATKSTIDTICSSRPQSNNPAIISGLANPHVPLGSEVCRTIPAVQVGKITFDIGDETTPSETGMPQLPGFAGAPGPRRILNDPVDSPDLPAADSLAALVAESTSFTTFHSGIHVECFEISQADNECGISANEESESLWARISFEIPECIAVSTSTTSTSTTTATTTVTSTTSTPTSTTEAAATATQQVAVSTDATPATSIASKAIQPTATSATTATTQLPSTRPLPANLPIRAQGSGCVRRPTGDCEGVCGTGTRAVEVTCRQRTVTRRERCQMQQPCIPVQIAEAPMDAQAGSGRYTYGPWSAWSQCTTICNVIGLAAKSRQRSRQCYRGTVPADDTRCINHRLGEALERGQCPSIPNCLSQATTKPAVQPALASGVCGNYARVCGRNRCCAIIGRRRYNVGRQRRGKDKNKSRRRQTKGKRTQIKKIRTKQSRT